MKNNAQALRDFYDAVGRQDLAAEIGLTVAALTNRYPKGTMPARWYPAAKSIAERKQVKCPDDLFDWVTTSGEAA